MKNLVLTGLTTAIALTTVTLVTGQSLSPTVIASGGDFSEGSNGYSLSWTLGEPVIETVSGGGNFLTQGFQQTRVDGLVGIFRPQPNEEFLLYPNPTESHVILDLKEKRYETVVISQYDLLGKEIAQYSFSQKQKMHIDFTGLPSATYLLKVMIIEANVISHHKVQFIK